MCLFSRQSSLTQDRFPLHPGVEVHDDEEGEAHRRCGYDRRVDVDRGIDCPLEKFNFV